MSTDTTGKTQSIFSHCVNTTKTNTATIHTTNNSGDVWFGRMSLLANQIHSNTQKKRRFDRVTYKSVFVAYLRQFQVFY